jgi:hypothetical protein
MFIAKPNDGTRRVEKKPQMGLGGYIDSYLGSPDVPTLGGGGGGVGQLEVFLHPK